MRKHFNLLHCFTLHPLLRLMIFSAVTHSKPVWDAKEQLPLYLLDPDEDLLLVTGGAEEAGLAGEWDEDAFSAGPALVARDALAGIAAEEKAVDGVRDDLPQPPEPL